MNSDGSDLTRLGEGLAPAWSPRGSRLAFVTSEDDATISVIDLGGTEPVITPLSGTTPRRRSPLAWSPDGTHIAYVRVEGNSPNSAGIAVVDVSSGQVTKLTSSFDHDPAWSPDGTQLTFTRGSAYQEIHVMNVDGSGLTRLTFGEDTKVSDSQPIWSPDGGQVAFLSISEARGTARICLINADGTGAECLMKDMGVGTQDIRMAWRP
jgi:TolB protein